MQRSRRQHLVIQHHFAGACPQDPAGARNAVRFLDAPVTGGDGAQKKASCFS